MYDLNGRCKQSILLLDFLLGEDGCRGYVRTASRILT